MTKNLPLIVQISAALVLIVIGSILVMQSGEQVYSLGWTLAVAGLMWLAYAVFVDFVIRAVHNNFNGRADGPDKDEADKDDDD